MKSLFFLWMTLIFIVLTAGNSAAQSDKTEHCFTNNFYGYLPCTDEISVGEGYICLISWKGKGQIIQKGTFIGTESGKVYTLSYMGNQIEKNWEPGQACVINIEGTASLKCEGATIALYKVKGHVTVNAEGEIVINRYDWSDWVCK
jgi:hypothetical protein